MALVILLASMHLQNLEIPRQAFSRGLAISFIEERASAARLIAYQEEPSREDSLEGDGSVWP